MKQRPEEVQRALVVGAGTMGHGIAQVLTMSGCPTTLVDVDAAALERGRQAIVINLEKGVARGKVAQEDADQALARLHVATDLAVASSDVDLAIEAVPERMTLKQSIFKVFDEHCPTDALLASNTSSLSIGEIGAATSRPESVLGLHFFNPVHIMKLLEIVRGAQTSDEAVTLAQGLSIRWGKVAITVRDSPGFATSRLGILLGNEAIRMVEEGVASAKDLDTAMELGYRHPMGPLRLSDHVGLDVRLEISEYLAEKLGDATYAPPDLLREMVARGDLGVKSGRGLYEYAKEDGV